MEDDNPPISEIYHSEEDLFPRCTVVSLDDFRLTRGVRKRSCKHNKLIYCARNRTIHCEECGSSVDPFEAFITLANHFHDIETRHKDKLASIEALISANLHRIAARNLDKEWSRKNWAVACPVCGNGLIPEDFNPVPGGMDRRIALERRKRKNG